MSVIIKGMEKPKDCRHCPLYDSKSMVCKPSHRALQTQSPDGPTPDWCPLIHVPKHGRLIDADELKRHQFVLTLPCAGRGLYYIFGWNDAIDAIRDKAPTIIPANKQEGNDV